MKMETYPKSVADLIGNIKELCVGREKWAEIFEICITNTINTTIKRQKNGTTFVLTGDIPAMWLRDSTAQVRPYLYLADQDSEIADMISGLVQRQMEYICIDPYANAFNEEANGMGHQSDHTELTPWIWERKYEIDSLCYPIQLSYLLWKKTGRTDHFDHNYIEAAQRILELWKAEQIHSNSGYQFERDTERKEDTLCNNGKGSPVGFTGMTWSGFRPSDDSCIYHYLVPSNMFASVVLRYLEEISKVVLNDIELSEKAFTLKAEIDQGIKNFAIIKNKQGKKVFAFEVDGLGNHAIMDDANVPSLLSLPYLGYCSKDDPIYLETKRTILSDENPYYFQGKYIKGIGSSHTPKNHVWPIALSIQGLVSNSKEEKEEILNLLTTVDAGTGMMHESINIDNPEIYTREWFSWANMMYCELLLSYFDMVI